MYAGSIAVRWSLAKRLSNKKSLDAPPTVAVRYLRLLLMASLAVASQVGTAAEVGEWLAKQAPQLTQIYKSLHASPELSFEEEQTAAKMAKFLRAEGFQVTENIGGHGVVGVLKNGPGKTLLLRADMDALPVVEETGLPYASQVRTVDSRGAVVGVMHACGHDMHMTSLVGTIQFLARHQAQWQGTLVAMFQPAEERGAGAKAMIAEGLLTRFPRPHFALALHVAGDYATGEIAYRAGYAMANVDSVDIDFRGRGGHGAHPDTAIDPVVIAARFVVDVQSVIGREINPIEPAVITVGSIHGGTKHNIIGDSCKLQLTVRSYSQEVRKQLIAAIRRKALASAASADAPEPEIEVSEGTPSLLNDPELTERVVASLKPVLEESNLKVREPSMGGEDFGRIGRAGVPILMMGLGVVDEDRLAGYREQGVPPPSLHSPQFYPDPEKSIETGVTALVTAALELLGKN